MVESCFNQAEAYHAHTNTLSLKRITHERDHIFYRQESKNQQNVEEILMAILILQSLISVCSLYKYKYINISTTGPHTDY